MAAVARKTSKRQTKAAAARKAPTKKAASNLLSGGNPQIAKGDGAAPVAAYIAAMPGWKRGVGAQLDAIITKTLPRATKAVKWNSPFYGGENGWFVSFHCYAKYVKVAFFKGAHLSPPPPGKSTQAGVRYLDIREGDAIDEKQFAKWLKQAAQLPGWVMGGQGVQERGEAMAMTVKTKKAAKPKTAGSKPDWRAEMRDQLRAIILAVPGVGETRKWKKPSNPGGVPVFEKDGIVCTLETYKDKVKLTFAQGAALADPRELFNASLDGGTRRAIDIQEGGKVDAKALAALVKAATALNAARK